MFLLILVVSHLVVQLSATATNCSLAPTESIRISCNQIANWAKHSKNVYVPQPSVTMSLKGSSVPLAANIASDLPSVTATQLYECFTVSCVCRFLGGTGGGRCTLPNGQPYQRIQRKEYRVMTDDERARYHNAIWTMKRNGDYDELSRIHSSYFLSPGAHSGPAFLPWHREFIKRFEMAIRRVDPTLFLPYWDSAMDNALTNPRDSVMWSDELMGVQDQNGFLVTGAFRNFPILDNSRIVLRQIGQQGSMLREPDIQRVLTATDMRLLFSATAAAEGCPNPASWTAFEYIHGGPHNWMGGDMLITTRSTNDPIFWNHHSFVDLIWEQWRLLRQTRNQRETIYPENDQRCWNRVHNGDSTMAPFAPILNSDGLTNLYTDELYIYAPRAICSTNNVNGCGSKYLFCDLSHGAARCSSKIMLGRSCSGYIRNEDMCYASRCVNNVCVPLAEPTTTTLPPTTTTPRVTTTPTAPTTTTVSSANCYNSHECCQTWANNRQCLLASNYMNTWCQASCGLCTPAYDPSQECSNRHMYCQYWSQVGECQRSNTWMRENCRQACNFCGQTRASICGESTTTTSPTTLPPTTTTPTPPPTTRPPAVTTTRPPAVTTTTQPTTNPQCINNHYCCVTWQSVGYCTAPQYQTYMSQYCRPSCNYCAGDNNWNGPDCVNLHPFCNAWANNGECTRSRNYMWENCKPACGMCTLLNPVVRRVTCGFVVADGGSTETAASGPLRVMPLPEDQLNITSTDDLLSPDTRLIKNVGTTGQSSQQDVNARRLVNNNKTKNNNNKINNNKTSKKLSRKDYNNLSDNFNSLNKRRPDGAFKHV